LKTAKYRLSSAHFNGSRTNLTDALTLYYHIVAESGTTSRILGLDLLPRMNVLIVQNNLTLGQMWQRHLKRHGHIADISVNQDAAIDRLSAQFYPIIILDVVLDGGSAIAVADYASYRHPDARVIFVTNSSFFSDGSIFQLCSNACAFVPSATQPEDLAAMVEHYAKAN